MTQTAHQSPSQDALLDELNVIMRDHADWLQSEGKSGRRANLSGRELTGMSLEGAYLPEANLRGANLTGVNFAQADLQGSDFSEAVLAHTNFRGASLDGANFSRVQAQGVYLDGASLVDANCSHAVLTRASAKRANLSGAKLRDAVITEGDFSEAILQQATLRHVSGPRVNLEGADLSDADCRDALLDDARFKGALLKECSLRNTQLERVLFSETDFTCALDLDSRYQVEAFEWEKRGIRQELDNLSRTREEVSQYEAYIQSQKRSLLRQRRALDAVHALEEEVADSLFDYTKRFRWIATFWFVVVSLFATVLFYRASQLELAQLNILEISVVLSVLIGVLGAHTASAVFSLRLSKKFAAYVRARREKVAQIEALEEAEEAANHTAGDASMTYM